MLYEQLLLVADDENLPQDRAAYDELVAYEKSLKIEKDKPNRLHPEIDFSGTYRVISGMRTHGLEWHLLADLICSQYIEITQSRKK